MVEPYLAGRAVATSPTSVLPGRPGIPRLPWQRGSPIIIIIVIFMQAGSWTPELLVALLCALTAVLAVSQLRYRWV